MLNDITFGQYFPTDSIIHRLDARAKILLSLLVIVGIFVASNAVALLVMGLFVLTITAISRVPLRTYLKSLKPIVPVIILTATLNAVYVRGGVELISFWKIHIYSNGVITAIQMAVRILLLIVCSSALTYCTSPTDLADAIERLLSPLKLLRLDVHTLAMMMTIAMRFVPTLIEETDKIMSAQKARGADMESGSLLRRVKALMPILIPLLISSFRRAAELADAMECRCYHGGADRTRLKQMRYSMRDAGAAVTVAGVFAVILLANAHAGGWLYGLVKG